MMTPILIFLLGILGTIICTVIGMIWYSMKTPMGKLHLESSGFLKNSKEEQERKMKEMKTKMWKYYLAQMFLAFLTSIFIAFIMIEQKAFSVVEEIQNMNILTEQIIREFGL